MDALVQYWPIILSILALVVWAVRIEGRQQATEKRVEVLEAKHDSLNSEVVKQLASVRESLARIEGRLSIEASQS